MILREVFFGMYTRLVHMVPQCTVQGCYQGVTTFLKRSVPLI